MIEVNIRLKRDNFEVVIQETFGEGITGIFGPSGSGKTSLLNSISGLVIPEKGEISIHGKTIFSSSRKIKIPVEKRHIGYVFQEGRLFPHMSVEKNLLYGTQKKGPGLLSFKEVVNLLNLSHLLQSRPSNISGGEQQRTALGRALLSSPELLLLDEPFSAVDAGLREQILPFLLKIQKTVKIPMLVVSHGITDLLKLTNRLCLIQQGQVIGHDDYHRLIRKKEMQKIFSNNTLINSVNMKVSRITDNSGLTILSANGNTGNTVKVLCEKSRTGYLAGEELKIFIRSDDIALSTTRLENITIQNQLEGTITDIIERDDVMLCLVDAGFPLVVEITAESLKRMDIRKGRVVWCLFKSVAIDVAG